MILISKEEKNLLVKAFPPNRPPYYRFPRTMKQDSKRHHYFCTESEELMRLIAGTNTSAAELVKEFDRRNELCETRQKIKNGWKSGNSGKN